MTERSRKNLKIGIGIFIVILGVLNLATEKLSTLQFVSQQVTSLAYIIVGILIVVGIGKIKEFLRVGKYG